MLGRLPGQSTKINAILEENGIPQSYTTLFKVSESVSWKHWLSWKQKDSFSDTHISQPPYWVKCLFPNTFSGMRCAHWLKSIGMGRHKFSLKLLDIRRKGQSLNDEEKGTRMDAGPKVAFTCSQSPHLCGREEPRGTSVFPPFPGWSPLSSLFLACSCFHGGQSSPKPTLCLETSGPTTCPIPQSASHHPFPLPLSPTLVLLICQLARNEKDTQRWISQWLRYLCFKAEDISTPHLPVNHRLMKFQVA